MNKIIHVVCLDAPSPPDYGAAIDMFYKLKALGLAGLQLHLHYFHYNQRHHAGLETVCAQIYRYPRKTGPPGLRPFLPYIVSSRISTALIHRLNEDDHPVLLEGIHCTGIIPHLKNANRRVLIRLHNDEALYYRSLRDTTRSWLRKIYYGIESSLLRRYQLRLPKEVPVAALATTDQGRFRDEYGFRQALFVPGFIPWQQLSCREGTGDYCLYHGNLQVAENEEAAIWLMEAVFSKSGRRLVIAGSNISARIKKKAAYYKNIRLVDGPDDAALRQLIEEAQVNILPSFNATGLKFKLLHALFAGRFCIANKACLAGSGLEQEAVIAETVEDYLLALEKIFATPFTAAHKERRKQSLQPYNNERSAALLSEVLYSRYP